MIAALLAVLTVLQTAAPATAPPKATSAEIVSIRRMFKEELVAVMWLHADREGRLEMESIEPMAIPFRITRHARPIADGVWVQLLSGRLEPLAAYRAAPPAPGDSCAMEVPLVPGTWYVVLTEHRGPDVEILARFEVGRRLAQIDAEWGG